MTDTPATSTSWWLYILDCDGRLYTGISTDPERRYREHLAGGARAAKFSRASKNIEMKYSVEVGERSLALRLEYGVKQLARPAKLEIVEGELGLAALVERLDVRR